MLEKDIKQEKSVILQCLRYIADEKFFGKGDQQPIDVQMKVAAITETDVAVVAEEKVMEDSKDTSEVTSSINETTSHIVEQSNEAVIVEESDVSEIQPVVNDDAVALE